MIPQINIVTVVDVIGTLSAGTLSGNMYMMDNTRSELTSGQGTGSLSSAVRHAQVLNWHVWPVDVQTDVRINNITFYDYDSTITPQDTPCAKLKRYGAPSGDYWAAVVNLPGVIESGLYYYQIEFDIGRKIMLMDDYASISVR